MPINQLHIFLSSPGDVNRERQLAREVIDQLESESAYKDRLKLEVVAWDKPGADTAMPAQLEPQEAIKEGLKEPSECDIVIVIFWARMGTPLSEKYNKPDGSQYRSGTEYEFIDAMTAARDAKKPDVLVYRCLKEPSVGMNDPKRDEKFRQWDLVEKFFSEFQFPDGSFRSFYKSYNEPHEFRNLLERDLRDLVERYFDSTLSEKLNLSGEPKAPTWDKSKPPFPGLRPFTPDEAPVFYGRNREIDQLIKIVSNSDNRFTSVVGASGSGKSSLVWAGLLPALEKDAIPGSKDWIWLRFTPAEVGNNPLMAFANAFKPILEKRGIQPRKMAQDLEADSAKSGELFSMALDGKRKWAELLLFIDQFEEFFTLVDPNYHQTFVDLLTLVSETTRVRAVVTMRSDFYHRCLDWPVLNTLVAKGQYPLLAPSLGALYEMITRPAELVGLRFEEGLPGRILDDTGTEPGALALMAFALSELWQKSKGSDSVLTHAAYESFNGVHGAIGKRAEDTFNGLLKENEDKRSIYETALVRVFQELVEVDERGVTTRKRSRLSQVIKRTVAENLINALTEARLLIGGHGEDREPVVEVAHEAIFANWPRFNKWIEDTIDDLRLLRQVRLAAAEWNEKGRVKHFLWPHERLLPVSHMLERMRPTLNPTEKEFVRPESERLLEEINNASTTHQQRVKIGDRLAEIGDPRPGVGLRDDGLPDIVWCEVPKGKISLREAAGTFSVDPFYISKYPVTWIQYRSFLEAKDGYRDERWWEEITKRDSPGEQYRKLDNHPAENVSWYEAVAYCRWLKERLGYEIRLPTEWEWQQAATGGDPVNCFPWGAEWDSNRHNIDKSGLNRTTAVGLYPKGVSPVGALDMSGNIREWCLNESDDMYHNDVASLNSRVLRGGSWRGYQGFASCASREDNNPVYRFDNVGFRVVSLSPILCAADH